MAPSGNAASEARPLLAGGLLFVVGTVAAVAAGWGVTTLAGGLLAPPEAVDAPSAVSAPTPPMAPNGAPVQAAARSADGTAARSQRPRDEYIEAIVARNIFDHRSVGQAPEAPATAPGEEVETELDLELMATVVYAEPETSAAMIMRGSGARTRVYGVGDKVLDATIRTIEPTRVVLERANGAVEYLQAEIEEDGEGRARRKAKPVKGEDSIAKVDDNHYEVDRSFVDGMLKDTKGLRKLGRARPYKKDGEVIGFRLYRIRRNSLGRKIGLRSGDVITEVNGTPLTTTRAALSLMGELNQASTFNVKVRKRGGDMRDLRLDLR